MSFSIPNEASEIKFGLDAISEILAAFAAVEDTSIPCAWLADQIDTLSKKAARISSASQPEETK